MQLCFQSQSINIALTTTGDNEPNKTVSNLCSCHVTNFPVSSHECCDRFRAFCEILLHPPYPDRCIYSITISSIPLRLFSCAFQHPSILRPSLSICCYIHFFNFFCWVHELNLNSVESLPLTRRLISKNTRALIKKQHRCHTLLHIDI